MSTMNISLPEELKAFVDQQVSSGSYTSSSEYVRELLRREQDREKMRQLILEGMASGRGGVADAAYLESLRERVRQRAAAKDAAAKQSPKAESREKRGR